MAGMKQRSGGARPGSGPKRRRIQLEPETARELAYVTNVRRALTGRPVTEHEIVATLIREQYFRDMQADDQAARTNEQRAAVGEEAYLQHG